jgi:hypothetical protein
MSLRYGPRRVGFIEPRRVVLKRKAERLSFTVTGRTSEEALSRAITTCPSPSASGSACSARRRGAVFAVYQRDAAGAFPKLHRVTIGKVLGAFERCFVVRAGNLCPAKNVAVLAQRVDPIIGHERANPSVEAAAQSVLPPYRPSPRVVRRRMFRDNPIFNSRLLLTNWWSTERRKQGTGYVATSKFKTVTAPVAWMQQSKSKFKSARLKS